MSDAKPQDPVPPVLREGKPKSTPRATNASDAIGEGRTDATARYLRSRTKGARSFDPNQAPPKKGRGSLQRIPTLLAILAVAIYMIWALSGR